MGRVFRTSKLVGNFTCIDSDPTLLDLRDHVFNPNGGHGCAPGVYDRGRKLVHQSFYSRGPDPAQVFPGLCAGFHDADIVKWAEEPAYIYLGQIHSHYGHFLLSTLSRLWSISKLPSRLKLLYIDHPAIEAEFEKPYVQAIFSALSLARDRFVTFSEPRRVARIFLPCPSFEEQNFAHKAFATLCNAIGDRATAGLRTTKTDKPAYLSKARMTTGVRALSNEDDIARELDRRGFDILYPETLSFPEQIMLWRGPRVVASFCSSGLHTSLFSPHPRFVAINHDAILNSSFPLQDWANGADASYFHFEPGVVIDHGPSPGYPATGFSSSLSVHDPSAVADRIAAMVDLTQERAAVRGAVNHALGRPAIQSSHGHEEERSGPGATSGILTGGYQFHTSHERDPWWQIDLGRIVGLRRIVVFNRTDAGEERSSCLRVLVSSDDVAFHAIYERADLTPFGGLNGEPLSIDLVEPRDARYVRLTIDGDTFLHLDQVEIYGDPRVKPLRWSRWLGF